MNEIEERHDLQRWREEEAEAFHCMHWGRVRTRRFTILPHRNLVDVGWKLSDHAFTIRKYSDAVFVRQ